jgi:hypothetical protein
MSSKTIQIDFSTAQKQLEAAIKQEIYRSGKSAKEVIEREFKGAMKYVFAVTPPMGGKKATLKVTKDGKLTGNVDFKKGRAQGELAISKDLSKAFLRVPDEARKNIGSNALDVSFPILLAWYKSKRGKNKRVIGKPKRPAWASQVERIKQILLKEQGITAAGWVAGARYFGFTPATWITKQATKNNGFVRIEETKGSYMIMVENPTNHSECAAIQKTLGYAFTMQANAIARRAADYSKKL